MSETDADRPKKKKKKRRPSDDAPAVSSREPLSKIEAPPPNAPPRKGGVWLIAIPAGLLVAVLVWTFGIRDTTNCEAMVKAGEEACVADMTRSILVDGKPAGQLQTKEEAQKNCAKNEDKEIKWCRNATDEWRACFAKEGDKKPGQKNDPACDKIFTEYWEKTRTEDGGFKDL